LISFGKSCNRRRSQCCHFTATPLGERLSSVPDNRVVMEPDALVVADVAVHQHMEAAEQRPRQPAFESHPYADAQSVVVD
jgi:hypothetical protein